MKNVALIAISICLFSLSLMAQNKTLDEILEKHKGKEGISEIEELLLKGIDAKNKYGMTALIRASGFGYTDIAQALIKAGVMFI